MLNYNFPQISHISDVLPHIEGHDITVTSKDWYTVINYGNPFGKTFTWDESDITGSAIRRECRGLIFDAQSGKLLSRPYHKFFNVGERPELAINKVDLSANHVIFEKLDGSMIRPIAVPGSDSHEFRLGSKAGITDAVTGPEKWIANHPNYVEFIKMCLGRGTTPIFEWCSRKNRIVIDYPVDRLVLTGVRNNEKGFYLPHCILQNFAREYQLDLVKVVDSTSDNTGELVDTIRAWESGEGVVVRFEASHPRDGLDQGHMLKIKADAYLGLHRSKGRHISNEKNVIEVTLNDLVDDLIPIITEADANRLRIFHLAFWKNVDNVASDMTDLYVADGMRYEDQGDFARGFVAAQPRHLHRIMYGLRQGQGARDMLLDSIAKSLSSEAKIDASRWMWGGLRW